MNNADERRSYFIDRTRLPDDFPTHQHDACFWEALGRVIATYGFLERVLGQAVFAITATTEFSEEALADAIEKWGGILERALYLPLGAKITEFERAINENDKIDQGAGGRLVQDLKAAVKIRNALCHASWEPPDSKGHQCPFSWIVDCGSSNPKLISTS